jgi:uncharacterized protein (TIGR00369 family)
MDLTFLAVELLDRLPANRTLGVTVAQALDGVGQAVLPVSEGTHNVIGALHSSGVAALADAAALAAILSSAPGEAAGRRLQPLGVEARLRFQRPVRGTALATCRLDAEARAALAALFDGSLRPARLTTLATIDGQDASRAAEGEFDWVIRLAAS